MMSQVICVSSLSTAFCFAALLLDDLNTRCGPGLAPSVSVQDLHPFILFFFIFLEGGGRRGCGKAALVLCITPAQ